MAEMGGGEKCWVSVRKVLGPVRYELSEVAGGRRRYLGEVETVAEARAFVGRRHPSREFRLVMRAGLAQRPAMIMTLRPRFGLPAEGQVVYWRMGLFEEHREDVSNERERGRADEHQQ